MLLRLLLLRQLLRAGLGRRLPLRVLGLRLLHAQVWLRLGLRLHMHVRPDPAASVPACASIYDVIGLHYKIPKCADCKSSAAHCHLLAEASHCDST